MGVDSQHYRRVTGLYASRVSSSRWSPSSSWRGRRGIVRREEGRADIHELWWREEVARQRREFPGRVLDWSVPGLLWTVLLHQLYYMLHSLWQQHGRNQPLRNITNPSETNFDALFEMKHEEHVYMDVLKAFLQVILIL